MASMKLPACALAGIAALGGAVMAAGCLDVDPTTAIEQPTTASCAEGSGVYTPYTSKIAPSGTAAKLVWRGTTGSYPAGIEDFSAYALPSTVECSTDKKLRSYLDVTAGCMSAVQVSAYSRGQVGADVFRVVALGHDAHGAGPVKWTDQSVQYRFWYAAPTNTINYPGFKVFARYNSEDDLYVASWRMDGVAQIQRKHCGTYTALEIDKSYGAPSPRTWHWIRFDVIGDQLSLYLDGKLAVTAKDTTFASGTAGIRIDSMTGAYLDDWSVQ